MRSYGDNGLGKSPLDIFNPVDKILFMGIPYWRAVLEYFLDIPTIVDGVNK